MTRVSNVLFEFLFVFRYALLQLTCFLSNYFKIRWNKIPVRHVLWTEKFFSGQPCNKSFRSPKTLPHSTWLPLRRPAQLQAFWMGQYTKLNTFLPYWTLQKVLINLYESRRDVLQHTKVVNILFLWLTNFLNWYCSHVSQYLTTSSSTLGQWRWSSRRIISRAYRTIVYSFSTVVEIQGLPSRISILLIIKWFFHSWSLSCEALRFPTQNMRATVFQPHRLLLVF